MNSCYTTDDLIVAPATALTRSALAVIRSSGQRCVETFAPAFSRPEILIQSEGNRIYYGWIVDKERIPVDEVLVTVFRAPASYTGEDAIEVSCHGGPASASKILELFRDRGFRDAAPGEFTFRAFFTGKMDLTKAEAVNEIINARTDKARALAASRLAGSVENVVVTAKNTIKRQAAIASLALDYPEDETESVPFDYAAITDTRQALNRMLGTWNTGRLYQEGLRAVLAGSVNAGKSSLFNLFLKEERSIVAEQPGTTRDWVEAWINFGGIPFCLVDTAGLRGDAADLVESEGIQRTKQLIAGSDIIIATADGCAGIDAAEAVYEEILDILVEQAEPTSKVIRVWNKVDVSPEAPSGWYGVSAISGYGFDELEKVIHAKALENKEQPDNSTPIIESVRQKNLLERTISALQRFEKDDAVPIDLKAEDLHDALDALGELTGDVSREDILNLMFGEFCVGK